MMSKSDDIFRKVQRGEISVETFLEIVDKSVMGSIRDLSRQVEQMRGELLRKEGDLDGIRREQGQLRDELNKLQRQPWPGDDGTLRKRQALLPAPTHETPPRLM